MSADPNRRPSNFGRYMFLLLFGLVLGAVATVMLLRALEERKDHFPDALMQVKAWHVGQLKKDIVENRCNETDALPHIKALRITAEDLEAAFPGLRDDKRFVAAASQLRATTDKAIAAPPADCAAIDAVVRQVGEACKACHQDFR